MTTEETTEETTGEIEMETEQKTNTVIGDIENQNTVTMTQQAYTAIDEKHNAEKERLASQIAQLSNDINTMRGQTIQGMINARLDNFDFDDHITNWMDYNLSDQLRSWAEYDLDDYIENWVSENVEHYIDTDDIARDVADYVVDNHLDPNAILNESLGTMCDDGKQQVADLVNTLIADKKITLPTAPAAPAGLDQQAIYTALDQIRGGVTALLAYMDANPPEVTE
mgnify:FL=1|tara:strand:+ start:1609 stop:2283 length:675 start_codon:yes stop_codon:yes gene_type:complete